MKSEWYIRYLQNEKVERVGVEVWPKLILMGPHCSGQKVEMCVFALQGQRDSKALVDILYCTMVGACPRRREVIYGGILWRF